MVEMDILLKWFIGFACVAVVAASGATLYDFYEAQMEKRAAQELKTTVLNRRIKECHRVTEANKKDNLNHKFCRAWLNTIRPEEEKRRSVRVSNCKTIVSTCDGLIF